MTNNDKALAALEMAQELIQSVKHTDAVDTLDAADTWINKAVEALTAPTEKIDGLDEALAFTGDWDTPTGYKHFRKLRLAAEHYAQGRTQSAPEGWKLVPIKATAEIYKAWETVDEMYREAGEEGTSLIGHGYYHWQKMVEAAAPPVTAPIEKVDGWLPIESAPKDESLFVCRDKRKPHVTFEAAMFWEQESWEIPEKYIVLQNMTTDEPIDTDWCDLEWQPLPPSARLQLQRQGD